MSEHKESAEPDPTIPDQQATRPGLGPPHSGDARDAGDAGDASSGGHASSGERSAIDRGQRATAFASALTSRTAGWIVAAGLTGSFVTLLLNPGTAAPVAGQVTIRNASGVAPAGPVVRSSWQIARTQVVSPKRAYVMPAGPVAGSIGWTMGPSCATPGTVIAPFAKRHMAIVTIPSAPWVYSRPGCAMLPLQCRAVMYFGRGPRIRAVIIKGKGQVVIARPGHRATGAYVRVRQRPVRQAFVVLPGARVSALPAPRCVALRRVPGR